MGSFFIKVLAVLFLTTLSGCGIESDKTGKKEEIMVFAAASLTESLEEIGKSFEKQNGNNLKVVFNFAGSQTLKTQIEKGAKADVFISAGVGYGDELKKGGFIDSYTIIVKNKLAIVKNLKSNYSIEKINDLAEKGIKIAVADKNVPAGGYWEKSFNKAFIDKIITAEEKDKINSNIVTNELNVKDVMSKVLLHEVDAGVVYVTDVNGANSSKLEIIRFPTFDDFPASYPAAVLNSSRGNVSVRNFYEYIFSAKAKEVFKKYGFIIPE